MRRALLGILSVLAVLSVVGCATSTGITYHHFDPKDGSYWMTTQNTKSGARQSVVFWRCSNYADGPACIQARVVECAGANDCAIRATNITGQVNLDPHYPKVDTAPVVSAPKPQL